MDGWMDGWMAYGIIYFFLPMMRYRDALVVE